MALKDGKLHYHIHWSGKATLDWESFDTSAEAEKSAKQLARIGETYAIEEHGEACPRCLDVSKLKFSPSIAKEAGRKIL